MRKHIFLHLVVKYFFRLKISFWMKLKEYVGSKLMSHTMRINRAVPIENCLIGFNNTTFQKRWQVI